MTQIRWRAAMTSTSPPASQRAQDKGHRPPQPQRPVIEAVSRYATQRIGIRQRHHWCPDTGRGRKGEEHSERLMLHPHHDKPERRREGRRDHRAAHRPLRFRKACDERQQCEARHGGRRGDHPDPRGINPDRLQPNREERQIGAAQTERRAVKQPQPNRESPGVALRCDGDL
jgi:hypothetical protein